MECSLNKNYDVRIESLQRKHFAIIGNFICTSDNCDNPDYFTSYLQQIAYTDMKCGLGYTYVACIYESEKIIDVAGFITLKSTSIINEISSNIVYGDPAIEITEFAVNYNYTKNGIGSILLKFAIAMCWHIRDNHIGVKKIVVCATPTAEDFYKRKEFGFKNISDYYKIPRERWNDNCIGLQFTMPEKTESFLED